MSATIDLDPWQAVHSHVVNCNKGCQRKKIVCIVGKILLAKALKAPDKGNKPRSFPFVAKLSERILANINGQWQGVVVRDRSISARHMYKHEDWKTGELGPWRTAASTIVGYEVELDNKERMYVRPYQIRSLRTKKERSTYDEGFAMTKAAEVLGDLIILRRN